MSEPFEGRDFTSPSRSPYTPNLHPSSTHSSLTHPKHPSLKHHSLKHHSRRDYHDLIDETCVVPSMNCGESNNLTTLYKDDDDSSDDSGIKSVNARAFLAGVLAFVYIYLFVWVADKYGPIWAGILGSVPGTLLAAIFFEKEERVPSLIFALILGGVAALAAAAVFYWLTVSTGLDKYTVLTVSVIIWVIVIGVLFALFKEKIESSNH